MLLHQHRIDEDVVHFEAAVGGKAVAADVDHAGLDPSVPVVGVEDDPAVALVVDEESVVSRAVKPACKLQHWVPFKLGPRAAGRSGGGIAHAVVRTLVTVG